MGRALKFYATIRMEIVSKEKLKDSSGNINGIKVQVTVKKNKVAPPFKTAEFDIMFDERCVDYAGAILNWLFDHGKLGNAKGWYEMEGKKYRYAEAKDLLYSNPKMYEKYYNMAYSV